MILMIIGIWGKHKHTEKSLPNPAKTKPNSDQVWCIYLICFYISYIYVHYIINYIYKFILSIMYIYIYVYICIIYTYINDTREYIHICYYITMIGLNKYVYNF